MNKEEYVKPNMKVLVIKEDLMNGGFSDNPDNPTPPGAKANTDATQWEGNSNSAESDNAWE